MRTSINYSQIAVVYRAFIMLPLSFYDSYCMNWFFFIGRFTTVHI